MASRLALRGLPDVADVPQIAEGAVKNWCARGIAV
jgi:hypothetical protein